MTRERISHQFSIGKKSYDVYFESNQIPLKLPDETLFAASLLPAMKTGIPLAPLHIDRQLYQSVSEIMDIYRLWVEGLNRIDSSAIVPVDRDTSSGTQTGVFFSGGVDSFFTLMKNLDEVDTVIFVHGFDVHLEDITHRQRVSKQVHRVANQLGKNVIEIETNLKSMLDNFLPWRWAHGAALASVAHLLTPVFKRIYLASTYSYDALLPHGSHPLLDPLWSSSNLQIAHHGCGARRSEKIMYLADYDIVLKNLRVCYKNLEYSEHNRNWEYNCGKCAKCIRTMIALQIAGKFDECTTFSGPPDLKRLSGTLKRDAKLERVFLLDNLVALNGQNPAAAQAIQKALKRALYLERLDDIKKLLMLPAIKQWLRDRGVGHLWQKVRRR